MCSETIITSKNVVETIFNGRLMVHELCNFEFELNPNFSFVDFASDVPAANSPLNEDQPKNGNLSASGVGILCDCKNYLAWLTEQLNENNIQVDYAADLDAFEAESPASQEGVFAWFICLSENDHTNERFVDSFMDVYADKPALFLLEDFSHDKVIEKVQTFLEELYLAC